MQAASEIEIKAMFRCLELAEKGLKFVAPNPMVGCVILHQDKIIGEGYHMIYGGPHAEVNAVAAVEPENRHLLPDCTLVVSLEPCAHHGKTPPCLNLVIEKGFKRIVIGTTDPNPKVGGKSIEKLIELGRSVTVGVLAAECRSLNKRFFCFQEKKRPYTILKWAQTADGWIGNKDTHERLLITGEETNQLVQHWRSEEAAILVGTQTALLDNPALSARPKAQNRQPLRVVLDRNLTLPQNLQLFDDSQPTLVIHTGNSPNRTSTQTYYQSTDNLSVKAIQAILFEQKITSCIVEGGSSLLQAFINNKSWDEIRVITSFRTKSALNSQYPGVPSPNFAITECQMVNKTTTSTDVIDIYTPLK